MTKKLTTKQVKKTTAITKKYTEEETRNLIKQCAKLEIDPERIIDEVKNNILPELFGSDKKASKKAEKALLERSTEAIMSLGVESDYALSETVTKKYQPLVMEFNRQLIKEFECNTPSEKALVQIVANSYVRVIDNSRRFNSCLDAGEYLSDDRTRYLAMLSKQLDRANRQFTNALATLKQIKAPPFSISVKAKTAFVAQNQQLNATQEMKSENIEAK